MSKTETLNLRVSQEFKRKLADAAAKQRRSVTNYLEVVLTEMWDREHVAPPVAAHTRKPKT